MNQTPRQGGDLLSWRSPWLRSVLALVLVVLAARLIWGWYADCLLQAQLDEIRRRGEPVVVDDVTFERVPDWENAWPVLVKAAQASQSGVWSPRASNDEYRNYPPYPPFWMKRAQDSEKANAQAFTLARRARALSRVQIRERLTSPMVSNLPTYNRMRNHATTV